MTLDQVMKELESKGSEQTRTTFRRHGAADPLFGVKFGDLRPLARRIGTDHELAGELWATGNYDARNLACMVADPARATEAELDAWLGDIGNYALVDVFVGSLAARVPGARARSDRWVASDRDLTAQAGWDLFAAACATDPSISDADLEGTLDLIERRILTYGDWTRRAANYALIGIALRDDELEAKARAAAARIGPIPFDPGDTGCVLPDAIAYIDKTKARRAQQAARAAART